MEECFGAVLISYSWRMWSVVYSWSCSHFSLFVNFLQIYISLYTGLRLSLTYDVNNWSHPSLFKLVSIFKRPTAVPRFVDTSSWLELLSLQGLVLDPLTRQLHANKASLATCRRVFYIIRIGFSFVSTSETALFLCILEQHRRQWSPGGTRKCRSCGVTPWTRKLQKRHHSGPPWRRFVVFTSTEIIAGFSYMCHWA